MKKISLLIVGLLFSFASFSQDLSALYDELKASVVIINVLQEYNPGTGDPYMRHTSGGMGTGVIINSDGTIITAAHVVEGASEILVEFVNGESIPADIIKFSKLSDVAKIKTKRPPRSPKVATLGNSDEVKIGERIFIIGSPLGLSHSLSSGYISGKHHEDKYFGKDKALEYFQTDAAINQGNSGGPMFNLDGEVIGICSFILTQSGGFEGIGFAATSNIVRQQLLEEDRFYLGLDGKLIGGQLCNALNVPQEAGFLITNVTPKSPGHLMGLKGGYIKIKIGDQDLMIGGDVILQMNDIKIEKAEDLEVIVEQLTAMKSGESFTFKVIRSGEIKTLSWFKK